MIASRQIWLFIIKKDAISLIFKDILRFKNSSKYISPILQIFKDSRNISLSKGNQSPKLYKMSFLGG